MNTLIVEVHMIHHEYSSEINTLPVGIHHPNHL